MGEKKLFLIGNGFDIDHGLETRYSDLMKFIKEKSLESDERVRISETRIGYPSSLKTIEICVNDVKSSYLNLELREDKFIASDSSIFFKELIKHHDINKTWGNIENIYFECFKKYVENPESLVIINKELDQPIIKIVNRKKIKNLRTDDYVSEPIFVHGMLGSTDNPCVFGYGDDNSELYKKMQLLVDYKYFRHFKTYQYFRSVQYQKVLGILEGDSDIDIEIIGHSCELCDKSLLKTIFTHQNVKKIKVNYNRNTKKYFKVVHNISRIIENNEIVREKVIPVIKCDEINKYESKNKHKAN